MWLDLYHSTGRGLNGTLLSAHHKTPYHFYMDGCKNYFSLNVNVKF